MMYDDPELYTKYHRATVRDCKVLLDYALKKMTFAEEDVIMDIGCGPGDTTKDIFLDRIPRLKKIVAIDVLPKMIEFANKYRADEKIEYHLANIEDKSTWKCWEGSMTKIFSAYCLHWMKDQRKTFQYLHDLLVPKGEALFILILSYPLWECNPIIIKDAKWNRYLKDAEDEVPESHHLQLGAGHYRNMFEDLGFDVVFCVKEQKSHAVKDDIEMKDSLKVYSGLTSYIPEELREEFSDDLFNIYMTLVNRNSEGSPVFPLQLLTAHIRKK